MSDRLGSFSRSGIWPLFCKFNLQNGKTQHGSGKKWTLAMRGHFSSVFSRAKNEKFSEIFQSSFFAGQGSFSLFREKVNFPFFWGRGLPQVILAPGTYLLAIFDVIFDSKSPRPSHVILFGWFWWSWENWAKFGRFLGFIIWARRSGPRVYSCPRKMAIFQDFPGTLDLIFTGAGYPLLRQGVNFEVLAKNDRPRRQGIFGVRTRAKNKLLRSQWALNGRFGQKFKNGKNAFFRSFWLLFTGRLGINPENREFSGISEPRSKKGGQNDPFWQKGATFFGKKGFIFTGTGHFQETVTVSCF